MGVSDWNLSWPAVSQTDTPTCKPSTFSRLKRWSVPASVQQTLSANVLECRGCIMHCCWKLGLLQELPHGVVGLVLICCFECGDTSSQQRPLYAVCGKDLTQQNANGAEAGFSLQEPSLSLLQLRTDAIRDALTNC